MTAEFLNHRRRESRRNRPLLLEPGSATSKRSVEPFRRRSTDRRHRALDAVLTRAQTRVAQPGPVVKPTVFERLPPWSEDRLLVRVYLGCSRSQRSSTRLEVIISHRCRHRMPLFNSICVHRSRSFWYFFFFSTMCCHSCGGAVSTRAVADSSCNRTGSNRRTWNENDDRLVPGPFFTTAPRAFGSKCHDRRSDFYDFTHLSLVHAIKCEQDVITVHEP